MCQSSLPKVTFMILEFLPEVQRLGVQTLRLGVRGIRVRGPAGQTGCWVPTGPQTSSKTKRHKDNFPSTSLSYHQQSLAAVSAIIGLHFSLLSDPIHCQWASQPLHSYSSLANATDTIVIFLTIEEHCNNQTYSSGIGVSISFVYQEGPIKRNVFNIIF